MERFEKENIELRKSLKETLQVCDGYRKGAEKIRQVAKREVLEGLEKFRFNLGVDVSSETTSTKQGFIKLSREITRELKELPPLEKQ